MSRKRSKKPRPEPNAPKITTDKKSAAIGQLESAILLWFHEADPVSILILSSNAEDCFHALGAKVGKPSFYKEWLETMPQSLWERAHYVQDFGKHGEKDLHEKTEWVPNCAEVIMISAADCCQEIYGPHGITPLMRLFRMRFYSENPQWAPQEHREKYAVGAAVYGMGSGSRKRFFEEGRSYIPELSSTLT